MGSLCDRENLKLYLSVQALIKLFERVSPLPLLVARIRADNPDHALAADDLALAADSLY